MTTTEMLVPMRHTTHITKGDAREHWLEQAGYALLSMMVLFLGQILLAVPAGVLELPALEIVIQGLGLSIFCIGLRLAYTIYEYAKV